MKAAVFRGVGDIHVEDMPEPKIEAPTDSIVWLTASAICGTDLHDEVSDDQAILLSDIFPTGYFGADCAEITPGDTVAVFGCGPVANLPSSARSSWTPAASWRLTVFLRGLKWRGHRARR